MTLDFYRIVTAEPDKKGAVAVFPDYTPIGFSDLMIRGGSFYAIWDEENATWSTDEYDVPRLVDEDLHKKLAELPPLIEGKYSLQLMRSFKSGTWLSFGQFIRSISDRYTPLDRTLTFLGDKVGKNDYVTKSLPYSLEKAETPAWDKLMDVLYSPVEKQKIEWAIGAVVSGDSREIQKFLVFYGSPGTGKSTVMNIIEKLFVGYYSTFDAKSLGSNNGAFATAAFKHNPIVGIQHDGDLSRIEDNAKLNSVIAHEDIMINEKFQTAYSMKINTFLFMGTNKPVRITDQKSGLVRRVIDVHPTGNKVSYDDYVNLMGQIEFELGGIAQKCLDVYLGMGKSYYNGYRPTEMMAQTDYFYNFVAASYDIFLTQGGITAKQAWEMFKAFCEDQKIDSKMPQFKFREELKNYFTSFEQRAKVDGEWVWAWYSGFDTKRFIQHDLVADNSEVFAMNEDISILDEVLEALPAQYGRTDAHGDEVPSKRWDWVKTTLSDIDTSQLHYVKVPQNHIVIDFDLKNASGEKSLELNLTAAAKWPKTYAELSKGGSGVHLHYLYDGDASVLSNLYEPDIEVKVFNGNSSLRRRLSKCNNTPIATISSGALPLKEKKVLSQDTMRNEQQLRAVIAKALNKTVHSGTKPNIDFIEHVLKEALEQDIKFDVTNMKGDIIQFALGSTHQSERCLEAVQRMVFKSVEEDEFGEKVEEEDSDKRLVFFDVEVYPNLFMICWKIEGDNPVITMINPRPEAVAALFKMRLVGFNCRKYDNHILYAAGSLGYSVEDLYKLSQKIINNDKNAMFAAAYNLSYTDVFDYASEKMTLKKWQIKLGIKHQEMDIPWDEPVPEDRMKDVEEYCSNDVSALEAVHKARTGDYKARLILAALSGLTPNHSTNSHSAAIMFGKNKRPQPAFKYTKLETMFPGYTFDLGKSYYKDELVGEGGYVYEETGIYENVELLDVASMHPTSIEELNLFGDDYTKKFSDIKSARLAIKRSDFETARSVLDGQLAPFLEDTSDAKMLSDALKIVINSVYGLTSARFENPFRDPRNKDNIVAKRGALFMIDLKYACQERGLKVVHIKTDSIKLVGASKEDISFVTEFGKKYGYDFEHEATYKKFCLINKADYVSAQYDPAGTSVEWSATGATFGHPYTFKTLFTKDEIEFEDLHEARSILKGALYLDFNDNREDGFVVDEDTRFIGRTGVFVPVKENCGGGILYRVVEEKASAAPNTKNFLWKEASIAKRDEIDMSFFDKKINDAIKQIEEFGSYEELVS